MDNRLINLHSQKRLDQDNEIKYNDENKYYIIRCTRYGVYIEKRFHVKTYGDHTKYLAENFKDLITTIDYTTCYVKEAKKYPIDVLQLLQKVFIAMKDSIIDYNTNIYTEFYKDAIEKEIKSIQEYQNKLTNIKKEIFDAKIKYLDSIINKKDIDKEIAKEDIRLCKNIPFNEELFKKNIEQKDKKDIENDKKDVELDNNLNKKLDKNSNDYSGDDSNSDSDSDSDSEFDDKNENRVDDMIEKNIRYISEIFDYSKSPEELIEQYDKVLNTFIPPDTDYYEVFCD